MGCALTITLKPQQERSDTVSHRRLSLWFQYEFSGMVWIVYDFIIRGNGRWLTCDVGVSSKQRCANQFRIS